MEGRCCDLTPGLGPPDTRAWLGIFFKYVATYEERWKQQNNLTQVRFQ